MHRSIFAGTQFDLSWTKSPSPFHTLRTVDFTRASISDKLRYIPHVKEGIACIKAF